MIREDKSKKSYLIKKTIFEYRESRTYILYSIVSVLSCALIIFASEMLNKK